MRTAQDVINDMKIARDSYNNPLGELPIIISLEDFLLTLDYRGGFVKYVVVCKNNIKPKTYFGDLMYDDVYREEIYTLSEIECIIRERKIDELLDEKN